MNILTVIPLAKGIPRDELSYFSARPVELGAMVTVPFGGRKIRAVVADAQPVRDLKATIKGASFQLKNIDEVHEDGLSRTLFSAAQKTAFYFSQSVGAVVETMIPKQLFEYYMNANIPHPNPLPKGEGAATPTDIQILQVPYPERVSIYKTLIRENFAKQQSTLIITPTVAQATRLFDVMKIGIEDKIAMLHGKIAKKKFSDSLKQVLENPNPVVVIATAPFASIIRSDWNSIIIEESSSPHYRYEFGPRFDMRYFIESLSKELHAEHLVYADTLIDTTLRARYMRREISELRNTWHIARPNSFKIVTMKPEQETSSATTITRKDALAQKTYNAFELLDTETQKLLQTAISQKSKIVLIATRKGLAPLTICADCGTTVSCPNCDTPLVLHRKKSKEAVSRIYMCHHCLHTTIPIDHCASCFGTRLTLLGISTDRIADDVTQMFPESNIFVAGEEDVTLQKVMKEWSKASSGILIGTHAILPYLTQIPFGVIVSMDTLLSLPSYTSAEYSLHVILTFLEKITDGAIIQTRTIEHDAVRAITNENLFDFMRNELASREQFNYPPTKVLVKISYDAKQSDMADAAKYLEDIFHNYDPDILMKKSKKLGNMVVQAIMKIDPVIWNDSESPIQSTMRTLSREFVRNVNPDSVI